ncbi:MAG: transcriptional regulator, partial [Aeromicrobium sp.]
ARHSEIALLVAAADRGLTTAELAVALSDDELPEVTIRAELSRLRQVLGGLRLESRPYRFAQTLDTDAQRVRDDLAAGRVRQAVARYRGPILPDSQSPAITAARDDLHQLVRSHLLVGDDPDALLSFADTGHGHDDFEVWERIARVLPASSPRYAQVVDHLERLDAELG